MDKFSEAFAKAKEALTTLTFAGDAEKLRPKLKKLFGDKGPSGDGEVLGKLRTAINGKALEETGLGLNRAKAKVIVDSAGVKPKKDTKAATLKMLKHFYRGKSAGGQVIWVYSPPKIYTKWIFDEVQGDSDQTLINALDKTEDEVYSLEERGVMCSAVQTARKVTMDVVAKLGKGSEETKKKVKQYFGDSTTTDKQLKTVISTLKAGYKKIASACNSATLVFSDEPLDRNSGGWKDWAFIYTTESMKVIYLQGAWLAKAKETTPDNQAPLYRCTRTLIHELSHKVCSTEDIVYGPKGLKPDGSACLKAEYALHNADSWAYFAIDLLGYLTGPDKDNGTRPTTAILRTPQRTLTVP